MRFQLFRRVAAGMVCLVLMTPMINAFGSMHYSVSPSADLDVLAIKACFRGVMPERLLARHERAQSLLRAAQLHERESVLELHASEGTLPIPPAGSEACVHYSVDLSGIGDTQWRRGGWRTGGAVVTDPALWLWLPDTLREDDVWSLDVVLPPGYEVSAPWRRMARKRHTVSYRVSERMRGWRSRVAFGRFSVETLEFPGGQVRYALLPGEPKPDSVFMHRWVNSGINALVSTYGRLPVPDAQLLVVPVGRGRDAVPWGEVQRGGGDAVHLYVNQTLSADDFMQDWVLVHELSHLLHPVIDSRDRWLYEGIASYYQNVLRARTGLRSPQWAWNALHAGFQRGIHGTPPGRTLADVSETMMRDRSFMRVYWSGAAIALLADVELRRRSSGRQSLDTALAALSQCCLPAERRWSARQVMQKLDTLTDTTVFMTLYRQHVSSNDFPDLAAVYAELGLQPAGSKSLLLNSDAPGTEIRKAIMSAGET